MNEWPLLIVLLALVVFLMVRWLQRRKRRINKEYSCAEGKFRVKGHRDSFCILKDNRFEFHVKDGQIVSVKDKTIGDQPIYYGGFGDGIT